MNFKLFTSKTTNEQTEDSVSVRPFVKWVGGKTQLLPELRKHYPTKIEKYCEPFVGGGSVLLDILKIYHPEQVLINDMNLQLISIYKSIRDNVDDLIEYISILQEQYFSVDDRNKFYYEKRKEFNEKITNKDSDIFVAGLFIFLNHTCFNGLYRVNKQGMFNAAHGKYENPMIFDSENLKSISILLKNVEIRCGDYKQCIDFIDSNTFVYLDPPYRPITKTASFIKYTNTEFFDEQQIELKNFIDSISNIGAKFILSNSDPKNTDENDNFFDDLYSKYNIYRVSARRNICSDGNKRGAVSELLIKNF